MAEHVCVRCKRPIDLTAGGWRMSASAREGAWWVHEPACPQEENTHE